MVLVHMKLMKEGPLHKIHNFNVKESCFTDDVLNNPDLLQQRALLQLTWQNQWHSDVHGQVGCKKIKGVL